MWKYEISQHSDDDENDWYYRYSEEWKEISCINNKVTTLSPKKQCVIVVIWITLLNI